VDALFIEFGAVVIHQKLSEALHGAQRGAHVMGYAVRECFQFADGFTKLTGALLDHVLQFEGMAIERILGG